MASGKRTTVFISYARKDGAELAQRLQRDLTRESFDVWLDTQQIAGGATWTKEIEENLDRSHVVLALLTPGSYLSEICRAEQLRSLRKGKLVIPLLAQQGSDIPLHLEAKNCRPRRRRLGDRGQGVRLRPRDPPARGGKGTQR